MSTISSMLKGITVTFLSGTLVICYTIDEIIVLLPLFIPIIALFWLDAYYLSIERQYRQLHDEVRNDRKDLDFDMDLKKMKVLVKGSKIRIRDCIFSKSIFVFYSLMIATEVLVIVLKFGGCF